MSAIAAHAPRWDQRRSASRTIGTRTHAAATSTSARANNVSPSKAPTIANRHHVGRSMATSATHTAPSNSGIAMVSLINAPSTAISDGNTATNAAASRPTPRAADPLSDQAGQHHRRRPRDRPGNPERGEIAVDQTRDAGEKHGVQRRVARGLDHVPLLEVDAGIDEALAVRERSRGQRVPGRIETQRLMPRHRDEIHQPDRERGHGDHGQPHAERRRRSPRGCTHPGSLARGTRPASYPAAVERSIMPFAVSPSHV